MWRIENPEANDNAKWLASKLIDKLVDDIENSDWEQKWKDAILPLDNNGLRDKSILWELLTARPERLFELNNQLMPNFVPGYTDRCLRYYAISVHKPKRNLADTCLVDRFQKTLGKIFNLFNYKQRISGSGYKSYKLTSWSDHNTCVYCNRQYTFTIADGSERFARPALDHWFPESLYPLLSLSYFNLIPSCTVCNSSVKGSTIFSLDKHVHPYLRKDTIEPTFQFKYKVGTRNPWEIDINPSPDEKENNTLAEFHLRDIYQPHAMLEVADLIKIAQHNNGVYLKTLSNGLLSELKGDGLSMADAYRLLLGTEYNAENFKNRPLSKLKRDILKQIEEALGIEIFSDQQTL